MCARLYCCWQFGSRRRQYLVRFLHSTVAVRVGGGWMHLNEFLDVNDPCRGKCSPADAIASPSSLAPVKSRMVYLSGASLPRLSWKKGR